MSTYQTLNVAVHRHDGKKLDKAKVVVEPVEGKPVSTEHRGDGIYSADVSPGQVRISVSSKGLVGQDRTVTVGEDAPSTEEFVLGGKNDRYYQTGQKQVPYTPRPDLLAVSPRSERGRDVTEVISRRATELGLEREEQDAPHDVLVFRFREEPEARERRRVTESMAQLSEVRHVGDIVALDDTRISFVTNEFLVGVDPDANLEERARRLADAGWQVVRWLAYAPGVAVVVSRGVTGYEALERLGGLAADDDIRVAEPNVVSTAEDDFTPDDFLLDSQPHLDIIGAEDAWDITLGDSNVVIAVIDSGCDIDHPDLDAPGKVVNAFDFETMDNDPEGSTHGTKSTGIATAVADNNEGVSGVAPGCRVIPIRRYTSGATDSEWADMYMWAGGFDPGSGAAGFPSQITPGADVISNSFGLMQNSLGAAMQGAFDTLTDDGRGGRGCVVVFSVGNANADFTGSPGRQWANYARTIAVASSAISPPDDDEVKVSTSSFGSTVDVCAPGGGPGGGTETRTLTTTDVGEGDTAGSAGGASDDYDDFGQTSCACPQVAGTAALMLSAQPELTWTEVRDLLRSTATRIDAANTNATGQWVDNDADGVAEFSQWYGFGRINAGAAVCAAVREVEILTTDLHFLDVVAGTTAARAIRVRVRSCDPVSVAITDGPDLLSGTGTLGTTLSVNQLVSDVGGTDVFLWVTYQNDDANANATGTVTVTAGDEVQVIPILANTIPRPTAAIALALDQSGSMGWSSGFPAPFDTRENVLKFAALPVADLLHDDDSVGMVTFDHDGHSLMPMETAGPLTFGAGRANARSAVVNYAHNPSGGTAIGDGVEWAHDLLDPLSGFDVKATVVLTDGHETAAKYLSEVASLIDERVYAIGLGNADTIEPGALTTVTAGSGGYLLLTGDMDPDDQFLLAKYYLQILAGVHNNDIVLDPEGTLAPGSHHKIPFRLNEQDIECDVILLSTLPRVVRFVLETPSGQLIDPASAGVSFAQSPTNAMYRFALPVVGSGAHEGQWTAHLLLDKVFESSGGRATHAHDNVGHGSHSGHGVRYSLNVHAWSNLRLRAALHQTANVPGASMTVRAVLTEIGIPVTGAAAEAEITRPDGTTFQPTLSQTASGEFEASFVAEQSGVYRSRVLASGYTRRGARFTREQFVTGHVWRTGHLPPPGPSGTPGKGDVDWCNLVRCVMGALDDRAWRRLAELGVDVERLRKCFEELCGAPQRTTTLGSVEIGALKKLLSLAEAGRLAT